MPTRQPVETLAESVEDSALGRCEAAGERAGGRMSTSATSMIRDIRLSTTSACKFEGRRLRVPSASLVVSVPIFGIPHKPFERHGYYTAGILYAVQAYEKEERGAHTAAVFRQWLGYRNGWRGSKRPPAFRLSPPAQHRSPASQYRLVGSLLEIHSEADILQVRGISCMGERLPESHDHACKQWCLKVRKK